jgi:hypothetical protein
MADSLLRTRPQEQVIFMFIRVLSVFIALVSLLACNTTDDSVSESDSPLAPTGISDAPRASIPSGTVARASHSRSVIVNMHDGCDPDTFNAVIGPGTCVRNGGMKFEQFIAQLTQLGFVGPWHFAPKVANAREGQTFHVTNRGGEVHTFTEVAKFGGGIAEDLNKLAHTPVVAPECLSLAAGDFIAPGGTFNEDIEEEGDEKYQCCIHPWMRLTVHVSESH